MAGLAVAIFLSLFVFNFANDGVVVSCNLNEIRARLPCLAYYFDALESWHYGSHELLRLVKHRRG